jgi:hypothetical protein
MQTTGATLLAVNRYSLLRVPAPYKTTVAQLQISGGRFGSYTLVRGWHLSPVSLWSGKGILLHALFALLYASNGEYTRECRSLSDDQCKSRKRMTCEDSSGPYTNHR